MQHSQQRKGRRRQSPRATPTGSQDDAGTAVAVRPPRPPDDVELRRRRTEIGRAGSPYFCAECNTAALNAAARNTAALNAAVLIDCRSQHNHQKAPRICRHSKQSHNPDAQSDDSERRIGTVTYPNAAC